MDVNTFLRTTVLATAVTLAAGGYGFAQEGDDDGLDFLNDDTAPVEELADTETDASDDAATPPPAASSGPRLDEIVVTAQKRAEDIQDVPLSVSAIGGETLKEKNLANLEDVAADVPNLHIEASPTFNYIYMRGIGSGYNRGFEQSVATIIDEVFYGRPSYLSNGMLDLYAIEVLRGPQGTLFGKNSVAGVLHLRTVNPEAEWAGNGELLGGEDNHYRVRGAFQGPMFSEDLSFRVAFLDEARDGRIFNTTRGMNENNLDTTNARLKIRWEPTGTFNTVLSVNGATVDQEGPGQQLLKVLPRHRAAMEVFDANVDDSLSDEKSHTDTEGYADRETWDVTSITNWDILGGDFTLTNVLNYAWMDEDVQYDADFSPIPFLQLNNDENYTQISEELRLTSPPGDVEYVVGAYFFQSNVIAVFNVTDYLELAEVGELTGAVDQQYDNALLGTLAGQQTQARIQLDMALAGSDSPIKIESSLTDFDQLSTSYALFGQGTWHATEDLAITVGLRGTIERKELTYDHRLVNERTGIEGEFPPNPGGSIAFPAFQPGNVQFAAQVERKEYDISPKVSAAYQWNDDIMTYITAARGFKSGGFNAQALNPGELEYESEKSNVYEVGIKSTLLDGAARLNISAFYSDYKDLQTTAFNGTGFVVVNAATAQITGIEMEGGLALAEWLMLSFSGAWTDAVFDSFPGGPCPAELGAQFPNFLTNFVGVTSPGSCDLADERLVNAPEWVFNADLGLDKQLFDWPVRLIAAAGFNYSSSQFNALDHDPFDIRPGAVIVRARLGLRSVEETWHFTIFGTNLTDVNEYYTGADVPTFVGSHFGTPTPPRTITAELGFSF
ncbi:MAG: TonB-dependent receptor [Alphaproteobacteria bacterium]